MAGSWSFPLERHHGQLPIDDTSASILIGIPSMRPSAPSGFRHMKVGVPFNPIACAIAMFVRSRSGASGLGGSLILPACQAETRSSVGLLNNTNALRVL